MKVKLATVNIGIKIGEKTVSIIKFLSDIVVVATRQGNIQCAGNEMHERLSIRNENK